MFANIANMAHMANEGATSPAGDACEYGVTSPAGHGRENCEYCAPGGYGATSPADDVCDYCKYCSFVVNVGQHHQRAVVVNIVNIVQL